MSTTRKKRNGWLHLLYVLGGALLLALMQTLWVCSITKKGVFAEAYPQLCQWDTGWYRNILETGYHSTIPPVAQRGDLANVAFFPAYPVLGRWVGALTGLDSCKSLLVVSQVSAWVFWAYFLLFLRGLGAGFYLSLCSIAAVFLHPAAFYMVVGYAEGLFMAALMGFLYWAARARWWLAALHGIGLSATRMAGLPVVFVPPLVTLLSMLRKSWPGLRRAVRQLMAPLAAALVGSLGTLGFFAFARLKFGQWTLYMQTLDIGWGVRSIPSAIYDPKVYQLSSELIQKTLSGDTYALSVLSVPLMLIQFIALLVFEAGAWVMGWGARARRRVPLYLSAWVMFHLSVVGRQSLSQTGMIRYTLPVFALLVLAGASLALDFEAAAGARKGTVRPILALFLGAFFLVSFLLQRVLIDAYLHGRWAA